MSAPRATSQDVNREDVTRASNSEDEDFFCADLFVNKDYVAREFDFGSVKQMLKCSDAASTDHDLTGQIVWPVSVFLAWFLVNRRQELRGKCVVEVGAGAGLSGVVASSFTERMALTDGNDLVLELLEQNACEFASSNCQALKLLWGEEQSIKRFEKEFPHSIDVIIGADVVCWPILVRPLLQTIKYLFLRSKSPLTARFYCGFVCRAQNTQELLFETATEMGFLFHRVDDSTFLPTPRPENVKSQRELQLLVFQLDSSRSHSLDELHFDQDLATLQTAC